jgi:PAT family acetyl-CoA transporter-like MFS transporter 1
MFVSQMAFFATVSDPKIGGTYMTLLNTLTNLGKKNKYLFENSN